MGHLKQTSHKIISSNIILQIIIRWATAALIPLSFSTNEYFYFLTDHFYMQRLIIRFHKYMYFNTP